MKQQSEFDKYKVIFLDDCFDSPMGSLSDRLEKLLPPKPRIKKGIEIMEDRVVESKKDTLSKLETFIAMAEECSTFADIQKMAGKMDANGAGKELWREESKSPLNKKDVSLWRFKLSPEESVYCYIEHYPSKTILLLSSVSKDVESGKKNTSKIKAINLLSKNIFDATKGKNFFMNIREELEISLNKISEKGDLLFEELGYIKYFGKAYEEKRKYPIPQAKAKHEEKKSKLETHWKELQKSKPELFNLLREKVDTEKKIRLSAHPEQSSLLFADIPTTAIVKVSQILNTISPKPTEPKKGIGNLLFLFFGLKGKTK